MKVHFISIGGSVMHNLAIALHRKGYQITGSDDEIYEPSHSRLKKEGLLPTKEGWYTENISTDLDAVVLGMHARKDNPELARAKELGLKIYSYPEYIYQQSQQKERVVIAGSHGKTTTTAMIMHVLQYLGKKFDYVIGAAVEGFETTVRLSEDAPVILIEGDEYLTSPDDPTPKFLHYHHHIALISGIAWDHMNVYPNFDDYVRQFEELAVQTPKSGTLIYCEEDNLTTIVANARKLPEDVLALEYRTHPYTVKNNQTFLNTDHGDFTLQIFGKHNMQNLSGAKAVCSRLAVTEKEFYQAIQSFKGASKRLEIVSQNEFSTFFRDFAHAPSKVQATINATKEQFESRLLVACAELHTFSSLNKNFLQQYKNTMDKADIAIVYYSPKTVEHKRLEAISEQEILQAFDRKDLKVFTDSEKLKAFLLEISWKNKNLLMMSSGTYDHIDFGVLAAQILK